MLDLNPAEISQFQFVPGKAKDNGLNGVSGDLIYTFP